ncbi:MAG: hypothetical protein A2566_00235 [Candidatus Zambryskibacteria bacterium RIFOXYD1_FULL_40_13]|nr:MAG: hypothetical protein UT25_C0004G0032 [Parcubacteria group bacterium GW2011_GWC1_39_12]KKR19112.1 MAG: hypothetical protein UT49_C0003G0032 [Parcubacteria group bacterium GW2011_GWF1_39_37]KKR34971.1 MAG: hypothetical protein UT68_C0006G0018 [Parcubacteria group bacterium GW2011_GWC2_40_10]KKR51875.1 MAG: hypothetical protein UT89_C0005G0032 [Parcubacteria group bacterium GW2011_GWE1_40_20]KKR66175.1 MAG: hypothetical protein UU06_C0004G0007 [Parcubacteria group bacterium GW2011_GWB1_40_
MVARVLQWLQVMPLKKKREKKLRGIALAVKTAGDIAEAGRLDVVERDHNPPMGVCARIQVHTRFMVLTRVKDVEPPAYFPEWKEFWWWINLRPRHFPATPEEPSPHIPGAREIHWIEFRFERRTDCRELSDPSTHLTIKSWE